MWRLRPHLTACIASGRVILLDERGDRYFAVPAANTRQVMSWLEAGDGSAAPDLLAALPGLEQVGELGNRERIVAEPPMPNFIHGTAARIGPLSVSSVCLAVLATRLMLRTRSLSVILESRRRRREFGIHHEPDDLHDRAGWFAAARRWCPIAPNCLLDSLALDWWLGSPANAAIVFGVVGQPFEAHCWVQSGQRVSQPGEGLEIPGIGTRTNKTARE